MDEKAGGTAVAPGKRAEIDKKKKYSRELAKSWILIAIVVLFGSIMIWWDASQRADIDASMEALLVEDRKMRAEMEALLVEDRKMWTEVEEMRRRITRERSSP